MLRYSLFLSMLVLYALSYGQRQFYGLLDKGGEELLEGNIPKAKQLLERALKIMPDDLSLEERAIFFNNLGVVYYQTGEYKKGIDWYEQELAIHRKLSNDSLVAGALYNLGLSYKEIGLYTKGMEYLIRSAHVFERLGNEKELSAAWNAIGNLELELGNFDKALMYHERALHLREKIFYPKGIADSYHNIGDVNFAWKQYAKAEIYYLESLRQKQLLDNQSNVINTLAALGKLYNAVGDPKRAYAYSMQAYKMAVTIGNSPKAAKSMCYLATYYGSIGEREKAIGLFRQTQEIARSSSDWLLLRDALQGEITLMEKTAPASEIVRKYHELLAAKEKVLVDLNSKELARLEISYDVTRKNAELKLRRKQASIDHLQKQRLTGLLVAAAGVVLIIGIAYYLIRRKKKLVERQKNEIVHLHHELSHRTKNYFSLLSGILRSDRRKAQNEEVVRVLDVNIARLDAMSLVQQHLLVNYSMQPSDKVQLDTYLNHLIEGVLLNISPKEDFVDLQRDLDAISLDYDKAMRIAIVLNELICNAIEHGLTEVKKPALEIALKLRGEEFTLTVRDNGPGMPEEMLESKSVKGRDLIQKVLHPINATIAYRNENGCIAEVSVPQKKK